ncbi:acyl-CoA dehydrogenase family protein [Streptomyces sp. NBC_01092]|uniref:acyl-CoA dehydrogenase family protein n=1 Tax=Streptomyces sp. NBC_01092 TaxID=2903748 RepID=UPI00386D1211|nr:acyl-CoA/acyl-ACP dehydrogenase [Streptomyces sp. NBC_01092]
MELTEQQELVRAACASVATDLRQRALAIDADPADMEPHLGSVAYTFNRVGATPYRFRESQWSLIDSGGAEPSCVERVIASMEWAYGDAGALMACPGPALAGLAVDVLGNEAQQEYFYGRIADGRTWTFFAMTEPEVGSDAAQMRTRFERDDSGDYVLNGAKRYVGNGDRGTIGVVWARTSDNLLGIRAALLDLPAEGCTARALPMLGLRGARLSEMSFTNVRIPAKMMLGEHLSASRRGLWGAMRSLHTMRLVVGALAIGTARAILDYVAEFFPTARGAETMGDRIAAARASMLDTAAAIDTDPDRAHLCAAAKLTGSRLAAEASGWALAVAGPGAWADHPLLEKWHRDARGFEFMDGTSNIQRLHLAQGYLRENGHG